MQWNASHVRLIDPRTGQLLREHRRYAVRGRHAINPDNRPARTPAGFQVSTEGRRRRQRRGDSRPGRVDCRSRASDGVEAIS